MKKDEQPLPDYLKRGLKLLFIGINPGNRSGKLGHHFAGYSNRFWKLLHEAKLTPVLLSFQEDKRLLEWGFGLTNLVPKTTSGSKEVLPEDFQQGKGPLLAKIRHYNPQAIVLLGLTLHRVLFPNLPPNAKFAKKTAHSLSLGLQKDKLAGTTVFLLPNPSGRNAHYSYHQMLERYQEIKTYLKNSETYKIGPQPERTNYKFKKSGLT